MIDKHGHKAWFNGKGQFHRINGPAIEYTNGDKIWYLNGILHNPNGPAIDFPNESKEWWLNGKRHCENGPAFEYDDGDKEWWLNGKEYTELEFVQKQMSETLSKFGYKFDIKDGNIVLIKE